MAMALGDSIASHTCIELLLNMRAGSGSATTDRKQPFAPQGSSYEGDGAVLAGPCPSCKLLQQSQTVSLFPGMLHIDTFACLVRQAILELHELDRELGFN